MGTFDCDKEVVHIACRLIDALGTNNAEVEEEEVMLDALIIGEAVFLVEIECDMRPKLVRIFCNSAPVPADMGQYPWRLASVKTFEVGGISGGLRTGIEDQFYDFDGDATHGRSDALGVGSDLTQNF